MDISTLQVELGKPQYAGLSDAANAATLNAPGAATITRTTMSRDDFLLAIVPVGIALASATVEVQAKWDRLLGMAQSGDAISISTLSAMGLFALAKADGLIDDAGIARVMTYSGSIAESLYGPGVVVSESQVGEARNNRWGF